MLSLLGVNIPRLVGAQTAFGGFQHCQAASSLMIKALQLPLFPGLAESPVLMQREQVQEVVAAPLSSPSAWCRGCQASLSQPSNESWAYKKVSLLLHSHCCDLTRDALPARLLPDATRAAVRLLSKPCNRHSSVDFAWRTRCC